MVMANPERIQKALDHFRDGLAPFCAETYGNLYGDDWLNVVNNEMHHPDKNPSATDVAFLLKTMKATWSVVWHESLGPSIRAMVFEIGDIRNQWAHQERITTDDTLRALDTMERVLDAAGQPMPAKRSNNCGPTCNVNNLKKKPEASDAKQQQSQLKGSHLPVSHHGETSSPHTTMLQQASSNKPNSQPISMRLPKVTPTPSIKTRKRFSLAPT